PPASSPSSPSACPVPRPHPPPRRVPDKERVGHRLQPPPPRDAGKGREEAGRSRLVRRLRRCLAIGLAGFVVVSILAVVLFGIVPPPGTPLMLIRWIEDGDAPRRDWVSYRRISPELVRAVMSAEDARFCSHFGVDWEAASAAWERNRHGTRLYGASTIT